MANGISIKANATNWQRSTREMLAAAAEARIASARQMATQVQRAHQQLDPGDTNRFTRGWLEACGEAGAETIPLPVLRPSRSAKGMYERITGQWLQAHKQVLAMKKRYDYLYPAGSKVGPVGRMMQQHLRRAIKRENRLKEELDKYLPMKNGPVIMIGGRGRDPYATVRTVVFGGKGFVRDAGDVALLYLWNREPHASIVNANLGINRQVSAMVRSIGGKPIGAAYAAKLGAARARSVQQFDAIRK